MLLTMLTEGKRVKRRLYEWYSISMSTVDTTDWLQSQFKIYGLQVVHVYQSKLHSYILFIILMFQFGPYFYKNI